MYLPLMPENKLAQGFRLITLPYHSKTSSIDAWLRDRLANLDIDFFDLKIIDYIAYKRRSAQVRRVGAYLKTRAARVRNHCLDTFTDTFLLDAAPAGTPGKPTY